MRIKRALPALLFAMVVMSAKAQVGEYRNKWNVGFNGGVNLNKVGFNPRVKQTYQIGPGFGAMIRYTSEFSRLIRTPVSLPERKSETAILLLTR